jgi:hypothetical protein
LIATESVIENGVGEWPEELEDSEICEVYGWTWQELQDTPLYVRKAFSQIQYMKNAKANQSQEGGGSAGVEAGSP